MDDLPETMLYPLSGKWRLDRIRERLPYALEAAGEEKTRLRLLDSFDWRLYAAGMLLVEERTGRRTKLEWLGPRRGERMTAVVPRCPRFAWDLPAEHPLRAMLEPVLSVRALLPYAEAEIGRESWNVLNRDGKTVLRLQLENLESGGEQLRLLRVRRIRGYPKPFARARRVLEETSKPIQEPELAERLARLAGRQPLDYSGKVHLSLRPEQPAREALSEIFLDLLVVMERNLEGTTREWDSEFLHDFRVAVRRTRSAITQVKGVFTREALARFREDFAWLGSLTGPSRDLDVYLLKFEAYRGSLPEQFRDDLLPFREFLQRHKRAEHRRLVRGLKSRRYTALVEAWRAFLEAPPADALDRGAARPVLEVASRRIWKIYRRVMKEGEAITDASPHDDLHELRKSCKKLRYLLEFFRSLYDPEPMRRLIRSLKRLQDNLGDFQDYEVQAASLRAFGRQMQEEGIGGPETMMAMGMLVAELERRQMEVRREFEGRFHKFGGREVSRMFKELFREAAKREAE